MLLMAMIYPYMTIHIWYHRSFVNHIVIKFINQLIFHVPRFIWNVLKIHRHIFRNENPKMKLSRQQEKTNQRNHYNKRIALIYFKINLLLYNTSVYHKLCKSEKNNNITKRDSIVQDVRRATRSFFLYLPF